MSAVAETVGFIKTVATPITVVYDPAKLPVRIGTRIIQYDYDKVETKTLITILAFLKCKYDDILPAASTYKVQARKLQTDNKKKLDKRKKIAEVQQQILKLKRED